MDEITRPRRRTAVFTPIDFVPGYGLYTGAERNSPLQMDITRRTVTQASLFCMYQTASIMATEYVLLRGLGALLFR